MAVNVDGKRLIELFAGNERKVADLYRKIGEEAGIGKEFFELMAQDEDKHAVIYNGILEKFSNELSVAPDADRAEYVDLLIQSDMLADVDGLLENARKVNFKSQIFDVCERVERDTVIYVSEFIELYPDVAADQMKIILGEEKKHLQKILAKKADRAMFHGGM